MNRVVVFGEIEDAAPTRLTTECLGVGREMADTSGAELIALFIGKAVDSLTDEAIFCGADKVLVVECNGTESYEPDSYSPLIENILKELGPGVLLLGHSIVGADLAPRLAFPLKADLVTGCVNLSIDSQTKRMIRTKPIYGGHVMGDFISDSGLQIATIAEKAFSTRRDEKRTGTVEVLTPSIDTSSMPIKLVEKHPDEDDSMKLKDAEIIVCGGRGVENEGDFAQLGQLAELLKGALGGTRPACERGWVPPSRQIGLTGEKVSPSLYIAVGLSGAVQHVAGITGAKCVTAINKDPDANIFKESDFGAVGDYKEILPSFREKLSEHLLKS